MQAAGKHRWDVQFEGDAGVTLALKSQQLLRNKPIARVPATKTGDQPTPPLLEDTDVSSSHHNNDSTGGDAEDSAEMPDLEGRLVLNADDSDDSFDDMNPFESSDEEEDKVSLLQPTGAADNIPRQPEAATDFLGESLAEDLLHDHGEVDIEPETVHAAKWKLYKTDKANLLSEDWIITKKSTEGGIGLGAAVRTKKAPHREGLVVGDTHDDKGKKVWIIDFGNGGELMRPQKLSLVDRNEASYVWKLVEDSEPNEGTAPLEYEDGIGLSGFNFAEAFKPHSHDLQAYDFPFLRLLQKMWPGDWKQQLRQLNLKATAENIAHAGPDHKNWRDIRPVTEREWWIFVGILISAAPHGKGGNRLWERASHREGFSMTTFINYGPKPKVLALWLSIDSSKSSPASLMPLKIRPKETTLGVWCCSW
jgi:hypothetical protein